MSSATPTPKPSPNPSPAVTPWYQHVITAVLAIAVTLGANWLSGGISGDGKKTDPPPAPVVVSDVLLAEDDGTPIVDKPTAGKMFTVAAKPGQKIKGKLTKVNAKSTSQMIAGIADARLVAKLDAGDLLHVQSWGGVADPTLTIIQANQGGQPPPDDDKKKDEPNPKPDPAPTPTVKSVHAAVIEDAANRSPATSVLMRALAPWESPSAIGCPAIIYDKGTKEAEGVKAVAALASANVTLPGLVLIDDSTGNVLAAVPFTLIEDGAAQVKKASGK